MIFDRRVTAKTPGTFRTRVITRGVDPQLCCYFKSSRLKQYFKEHRALRTETVIGDTRDFDIGRRVNAENWHALRAVGDRANQRLCDAQASDAQPAPDMVTLTEVTRPSVTADGQHVPALRFGDARVMALMAAIVGFTHLITGFDNKTLTGLMTTLLAQPYTARQTTYDLRRLRRKGQTPTARPPLPAHRSRPTCRGALHQDLRQSPRCRTDGVRPGDSQRGGQTPSARHRLAEPGPGNSTATSTIRGWPPPERST